MGDLVSSDHEWVEFYNDGDAPVDLSGWKLVGTDTSDDTKEKFSIALSGTISAKGFFLVERKRSTSDTAPYFASDFTTVTFSLLNTGETITLKNGDGTKADEVRSLATKWQAGNNTTKETMQKNGSEWITAKATPRAENALIDSTPITSTTETDTPSTETVTHSTALDTSAHVSPLPLSDFSQKQELYISAGRNRIVSVGNPVTFEAYAIDAKGIKSNGVTPVWSFGDSSQAGGTKVTHIYKYPGDYVVILNASAGGNEAVSRAEVRVFAPKIILSVETDGAVSLMNDSTNEINIGGWKISATGGIFVISSDTIIKAGKKLIFPATVTIFDFSSSESIQLLTPDGVIVTTFSKTVKPIVIFSAISPEPLINPVEISTPEPIAEEPTPDALIISTPQHSKNQTASVVLAIPEKTETLAELPTQKIILGKQQGIWSRIWNFFF